MRLPISVTLPTQADTISGVLDHGFELYARSFWRTSGFIAISSLPNALLGLVAGELQGSLVSMATGAAFSSVLAKFWWFLPLYFANLWFTLSLYNAAYYRTGMIARGRDAGFVASAKYGFAMGHRALGLALISLVLIFVAMVIAGIWLTSVIGGGVFLATTNGGDFGPFLSIVFGLLVMLPAVMIVAFVMVPIMLAPCALALRREGVIDALATGFRLMGRHFWRNIIVMAVPGALYFITYSGILGVLGIAMLQGSVIAQTTAFNILAQALVVPLIALLMPLFISSVIALFADLLLRRDGEDLKQQLAALT